MKTYGYSGRNYSDFGKVAEATSSNQTSHVVTIKDDFGNVKNVIHYTGVSKQFVEADRTALSRLAES